MALVNYSTVEIQQMEAGTGGVDNLSIGEILQIGFDNLEGEGVAVVDELGNSIGTPSDDEHVGWGKIEPSVKSETVVLDAANCTVSHGDVPRDDSSATAARPIRALFTKLSIKAGGHAIAYRLHRRT